MPPKRKQPDGETAANAHSSIMVKKLKLSSHQKKTSEVSSDETVSSPSASPVKKNNSAVRSSAKPNLRVAPQPRKKTSSKATSATSKLVPRGERKKATLGQKDVSLLRMLCDDSQSGIMKELHFRKIPHSTIDWNNPKHISDINSWRNQIYGRAGWKAREVTVWHEEEELWFELYYQLSIAESLARGILLPKTKAVLDAFNETFVGRVLKDKDGDDIEARAERKSTAFESKFRRMCPQLRARLHQCVVGKSGDVFVPKITPAMLEGYKQMKAEMVAKGIKGESAYSDHLEEWQHFLSHLPDIKDVEMKDVYEGRVEASAEPAENEAATVLVSLANCYRSPRFVLEDSTGFKSTSDHDKENVIFKFS